MRSHHGTEGTNWKDKELMQEQSILVAENFSRADWKETTNPSAAIYKQQRLPKVVMYIPGLHQPKELTTGKVRTCGLHPKNLKELKNC